MVNRSPGSHRLSSIDGIRILALFAYMVRLFLSQEFNVSSLLSECQLLLVNSGTVHLLFRSLCDSIYWFLSVLCVESR